MSMAVVLQGMFDNAIFTGSAFCENAQRSIIWTKCLLESSAQDDTTGQCRIDFLATLPDSHLEGDIFYVHGSPRHHRNDYVFPEDIYNRPKMERIGTQFKHVCFNGHTHRAGIFVECGPGDWQFTPSGLFGEGFQLDGRKVICNVGSVGQPRDGNWRAEYVLFDGKTVLFRRVEYDVEATITKIFAVPELGTFTGERLRVGR